MDNTSAEAENYEEWNFAQVRASARLSNQSMHKRVARTAKQKLLCATAVVVVAIIICFPFLACWWLPTCDIIIMQRDTSISE